jgi:hypothetical protein
MEENNSEIKTVSEEILINCRMHKDTMIDGRCISGENTSGQRCSIPLTYATKFRKNTDGSISIEGGERKMKLTKFTKPDQLEWFNAMAEPEKCFVEINNCKFFETTIVGSVANKLHRLHPMGTPVTVALSVSKIFEKDGWIIVKSPNTQWKIVSFFQDNESLFRKKFLSQTK